MRAWVSHLKGMHNNTSAVGWVLRLFGQYLLSAYSPTLSCPDAVLGFEVWWWTRQIRSLCSWSLSFQQIMKIKWSRACNVFSIMLRTVSTISAYACRNVSYYHSSSFSWIYNDIIANTIRGELASFLMFISFLSFSD